MIKIIVENLCFCPSYVSFSKTKLSLVHLDLPGLFKEVADN